MFLTRRFYIVMSLLIIVVAVGYALPPLMGVGMVGVALLVVATAVEVALLYQKRGVEAWRSCDVRFSNGDDNRVDIRVENHFGFRLLLEVIDESPVVFQRRDIVFTLTLQAGHGKTISYTLRPTQRGDYAFGQVRVFASTSLGLAQRRFSCAKPQSVKVYPAFMILRQYELLAISNQLTALGIKRIRRVGNYTEFEQIKDYVAGDDFRTINWKASARRHELMVNVYQTERSQQVLCLIDKGRVMHAAFQGMSLLDYAINASLALSFVAMHKEDKAGIATFCQRVDNFVTPSRQPSQMRTILDTLYNVSTDFGESDFSTLTTELPLFLRRRSLVVLFTNFHGTATMQRQLPYLKQLARHHRLLVVFFANTSLHEYVDTKARTTADYYEHVVAETMIHDQQLAAQQLRQHGILSLLTTPEQLSVNVINKYLEIKQKY